MMFEKDELVLNNTNDKIEQTEKQSSIDRLAPIALVNHPDKKPPVNPPIPSIIILKPRRFCPSPTEIRFCIQVGIQEKIAHKPMSMAPKITEPLIKSVR